MRKLHFMWLAVVLPAGLLRAQPLTRDEAVRIALKNNLGIELAKNNAEAAAIYNSYGIAGGLPVVTGSISDQEQSTSIKQEYANPANNKSSNNAFSNNLSGQVNGYVLLYNGERVVTAKKRLGTQESQARQLLNSRALMLVNNVLLKYYDVVRQQSYARTLQASIDAQKQQLAIVQAQQSVGLANNADLFQSQVDLNTQIQNLQAQQLVIDQGKTDLLTLLTLNPDSVIAVEDTILIDKSIRLPDILGAVQTTNPDIIAANEQISINQYVEKETGAQRYPSLGANAGYNYSRTRNSAGFSLLNLNYGPYAAVTLNIPIFNGNIYRKQQQVAGLNIRNAALVRDTLLLNYTANAVKNFQAYTNNLQQVETAKANYELSQKLLDLVMKRFQLRQATIVDVKNAQQSFENAGFLLVNVSYAAKAAEIALRRYANQLTN
ncbi:TolC family protein [Puia dinghuensis]|uniref:Transporter n=1 Tax=Puia dinghuensis TaxID=1792502 RepID=A0A8J2U6Y5_9BACT|nr:TolC family protein [Puia dinghuensis]GGA83001.1 transporter [Puia dinghuensis]